MLTIVIEVGLQSVAEEAHVEAVVLLEGFLPRHVGIVLLCLDGTHLGRSVLHTEVVAIRTAVLTGTVEERVLVDVVGIGQIHETCAANLVVTDETPGGAQLEEADHLLDGLEERLVAGHPAKGTGGEEAEALARREVLRTIVAHVELGHVAVVPVVGHTAYEAEQSVLDVGVSAGIVFLALVVQGQGADGVQTERATVVESRLEVPPAGLAAALAVARLCGIAVLAIAEDVLTVFVDTFPDRCIGGHAGTTVLEDFVVAVVRPLDVPGEALGDHAEVLLQLQVHGQVVAVGVHEALVVVVAQGTAADEGQHVAVEVVLGVGRVGDIAAVDDAGAGERRGVIHIFNDTRRSLSVVWFLGLVDDAAEVSTQRGGLRDVDVDVGAVVEAVVAEVVVVALVELLEESARGVHAGTDEVLHCLRAT